MGAGHSLASPESEDGRSDATDHCCAGNGKVPPETSHEPPTAEKSENVENDANGGFCPGNEQNQRRSISSHVGGPPLEVSTRTCQQWESEQKRPGLIGLPGRIYMPVELKYLENAREQVASGKFPAPKWIGECHCHVLVPSIVDSTAPRLAVLDSLRRCLTRALHHQGYRGDSLNRYRAQIDGAERFKNHGFPGSRPMAVDRHVGTRVNDGLGPTRHP